MMKRWMYAVLISGVGLFALAACSSESDGTGQDVASPEPTPTSVAVDPVAPVADEPVVQGDSGSAAGTPEDSDGLAGQIVDGEQRLVELPGWDQPPVVINVSFQDGDVWPKQVAAPVGRQVQLVLRNHDQAEHHYHISGMPTDGIRWMSKEADETLMHMPDEEHEAHHPEVSMVPFHICTSLTGVCPTGEWIHAHAQPADMDIIIFVPNLPGVYDVTDPLNPDLSAKFTVFEVGVPNFAKLIDEADARASAG